MHRLKNRLAVFLAFYMIICSSAGGVELELPARAKSGRAMPGEVIIEVKRGIIDLGQERGIIPRERVNISSESLSELNRKHNLLSVEKLFSGTRKDEPSDIYVFRFYPQVDIDNVILDYSKDTDVLYMEPNYAVRVE